TTLKNNALSLTSDEEFVIFGGSDSYPQVQAIDSGFEKVTIDKKVEMVLSLEKHIKALDQRIVFVPYCGYSEVKQSITIINSLGLNLTKANEYAYLVAQAVAKENDDTQSCFDVEVKLRYDDLHVETLAKKVVDKTLAKLNASPVASKNYPIIFEREAMGDLFNTFDSFFSGEAAIKKLTPLLNKEGEKIMSDKITIVDDPLHRDAINLQPFDDEGVACYRKTVVEKGVFKTLLHNLKTAKYFKTTSTGNGFKPSVAATVNVSGTNLLIEPGEKTLAQLVSETQEGLLITELTELHAGANPITGDFSAQSSGFLIKDGKIDRPVNLIVVSGNFLKMMNDVESVGSDLKLGYNGIGTPSIKFVGLQVSGK
ncbi:MAG TPA: metallopeptidase TldD-related protein, partial [Bacilli bacterium]|nr:metallopeptidase TldD-related protein [Bacilli bacterium]